jgi:hypothetical protein
MGLYTPGQFRSTDDDTEVVVANNAAAGEMAIGLGKWKAVVFSAELLNREMSSSSKRVSMDAC